jgi:hypothetical protein
MKKLLLSAAVLLAFSGAANAQTANSGYVVCGNCAGLWVQSTVICRTMGTIRRKL